MALIPCDICGVSVEFSMFLEHATLHTTSFGSVRESKSSPGQARSNASSSRDTDRGPLAGISDSKSNNKMFRELLHCYHCAELIPTGEYESHSSNCQQLTLVPCEVCFDMIPIADY